jgi:hypothetical protein
LIMAVHAVSEEGENGGSTMTPLGRVFGSGAPSLGGAAYFPVNRPRGTPCCRPPTAASANTIATHMTAPRIEPLDCELTLTWLSWL